MKNMIENWIDEISKTESIPEGIKAVNFGIFESESGYVLYITGSEIYDINNDDWACEIDWELENQNLEINGDEYNNLEWDAFQNKVSVILKSYLSTGKTNILSKIKIVTVGFDDGDLEIVKFAR